MHNNFYFLRQLSKQLNEKISGYSIVSCFSQSKDELIIELNNSQNSFFIKANLSSNFCCLSFPNGFHRARKNSIDLFDEVILKKIICVKQFENERAFAFELENNCSLIFKMHGNFANVLLAKENSVQEIFRNHLQTDFETNIEKLNRVIDFSKENFIRNISNLKSLYFTFGKHVWDFLEERSFNQLDIETKWKLIHEVLNLLEKPKYYLIEKKGQLIFSLLPFGKIENHLDDDAIKAINTFADQSLYNQIFYSEKAETLRALRDKLESSESYVTKNKKKLEELHRDNHYQLWGDLIMANMHVMKQGLDKISLNSFYDGNAVEIKLKKELTPQKNAETFYRKSKNHQIEINKLTEAVHQKENEIEKFSSAISSVEDVNDLKTLREKIGQLGIVKKSIEQKEISPYHEFEFKGYKIWVGKNAEANDKLTLKYSYKEDLWLHAKDVSGSHVLVKYQSGKNFPKDVIEYAASLAAFYSKRKNESLCPVAFTPKKYVRKRKGEPAGAVVVEREEVILVEPRG